MSRQSLAEYKKKRDFTRTEEPPPEAQPAAGALTFVVQKHDASRLHYDFRLAMEGVLKSWAVPKGFPWARGERRLAVHVEDHPADYAGFEGIIPKGQYGGGTVMVWDRGTYEIIGADGVSGLKEGKLHLQIHGEKLKGEWTLVRGRDEENWFLIKTGEAVKPVPARREDQSVLTGRTMKQIASQKSAVWQSNDPETADEKQSEKPPPPPRQAAKAAARPKARGGPRGSSRPAWVEPMKAKSATAPPKVGRWLYELKWDGFRAIAVKDGSSVELISRSNKPMTSGFPEICHAIAQLPVETAVLDGEICALDPQGRPRFQLLQSREMSGTKSRPAIFYYAFDLLQLGGENLMANPLKERKGELEALLAGNTGAVRFSASLNGDVELLLNQVRQRGMEGIVAKQEDSPYEPGRRSGAWLKLKVASEQEFVIGGFTPPQGTRERFGALLVGYYEGSDLRFAGKVGTGFDSRSLNDLYRRLTKIKTDACPFVNLPKKSSGKWGQAITPAVMRVCRWTEPRLVCQIRFAEWTEDGSLRQPVFLGLREDKEPREVIREPESLQKAAEG